MRYAGAIETFIKGVLGWYSHLVHFYAVFSTCFTAQFIVPALLFLCLGKLRMAEFVNERDPATGAEFHHISFGKGIRRSAEAAPFQASLFKLRHKHQHSQR